MPNANAAIAAKACSWITGEADNKGARVKTLSSFSSGGRQTRLFGDTVEAFAADEEKQIAVGPIQANIIVT